MVSSTIILASGGLSSLSVSDVSSVEAVSSVSSVSSEEGVFSFSILSTGFGATGSIGFCSGSGVFGRATGGAVVDESRLER
jgi:hypothetical protein